jgi:hypothetical protein
VSRAAHGDDATHRDEGMAVTTNGDRSQAARALLREIRQRQEQVARVNHRMPRWLMVAQGVLLAAFVVALDLVASPWVALTLLVAFLAGWAGLIARWVWRRPALAHPSQYVRGRVWLAVGAGLAVGGLVGAGASVLTDRLGAVGLAGALVLMVGLMVAGNVAHPRLMQWARRRAPEDPGEVPGR